MPDRQITIKVSLDGLTDASSQADAFSGSVKGVGDAAAAATSQAAPLGTAVTAIGTASKTTQTSTDAFFDSLKTAATRAAPAVQAVVPPLTAIETASNTAQAALDKLGNVTGVRGLSISIVQAQMAMEAFKKAAADAEASGTKMPPAISNSLKAMQSDITNATQRLGDLRKAQTDLASTSALAGSQLDKLRMSGTTLSGLFQSMEQTGQGLTKSIGQIGMGVGIASMAFMGAEAAGVALGKVLLALEAAYSAFMDKQKAVADMTDLDANVIRNLTQGHITLGKTLADTIGQYELYLAASGKAGIATQTFVEMLKNIKPPQSLQEATRDVAAFAATLEGAMKKGPEEAALFIAAHKDVMDKMVQFYATIGQRVPQELQNIVDAQKQAVAAQKLLTEQGAQAAIEGFAKIATAQKTADDAAGVAAVHAQGRFEAQMKNLNQEILTSEQYSERKKALYAEESAAEQIAIDKQAVADAQAVVDQLALQKTIGLSHTAFEDVAKAAADYAKDVAAGVAPSTALSNATAALSKNIEATKEAVPQLTDGVDQLWKKMDSLNVKLGTASPAAGEMAKQVAEMHKQVTTANEKLTDMGILMDTLAKKFPLTGTALGDLITKLGSFNGVAETTVGFL